MSSKSKINSAILLFPITTRKKIGRLTQTDPVASSNYRYYVIHHLTLLSFRKSQKSYTTRQRIATVWDMLIQNNKMSLFYARNLIASGFTLLNYGHKNECIAFSHRTMTLNSNGYSHFYNTSSKGKPLPTHKDQRTLLSVIK